MKKILLFILKTSFLFFLSCDCRQTAKGVVLDLLTKKPIDSVLVIVKGTSIEEHSFCYTNEDGEFSISGVSGGFYKCPPMPLVFKKQGYDSVFKEIDLFVIDTIQIKPIRNIN